MRDIDAIVAGITEEVPGVQWERLKVRHVAPTMTPFGSFASREATGLCRSNRQPGTARS